MYNNVSIGNSGEYFVAGELERRGFTAAVPMSNTKDFDILAINRSNNQQFAIQVKTTKYKKKEWTLSCKNEELFEDNIFYIFVSLNITSPKEMDAPEYHIVPSSIVAETIKREHEAWYNTPAKNGKERKNTAMRKFNDKNDLYLGKWEYLDK